MSRTLNRVVLVLATVLLPVALAGCGGGKVVSRVGTGEQIDLSGNWNDVDSRQVADDLVAQATTGTPWIENYLMDKGTKPTLIVGTIRNKSAEHIPMKTLVADLEKTFINSGRVRIVASAEEREGVREERADQQEYASPESQARWGREKGADYMLLGEVNTIIDREGGKEVKFYQVDSYLVDLRTNEKVWVGQTKIKKFVGRRAFKP
ncbi:MAG: penicillin-binding protein activator LpoB [Candidatus Krumholzibacteriia bacterium]